MKPRVLVTAAAGRTGSIAALDLVGRGHPVRGMVRRATIGHERFATRASRRSSATCLAESARRARVGAAIATSYREQPQSPEDDELAMASAIAMTEAEPW